MALNINQIIVGGRITKDPEVRVTSTGTHCTQFTLAVDRIGDSENTDFINCVAWKQSADYLSTYAHKGDTVVAEGSLMINRYEKDGKSQTFVQVNARRVQLIGGTRRQDNQSNHQTDSQTYADSYTADANTGMNDMAISSDDLPF